MSVAHAIAPGLAVASREPGTRKSESHGSGARAGPRWVDVGPLDAIPRLGARRIETPDGEIAVFRTATDGVFALDNRCPHRGGPLSEGIVHGESVTCPLHNLVLNLLTGSADDPEEGCARTHPVRLEGGRILLGLVRE